MTTSSFQTNSPTAAHQLRMDPWSLQGRPHPHVWLAKRHTGRNQVGIISRIATDIRRICAVHDILSKSQLGARTLHRGIFSMLVQEAGYPTECTVTATKYGTKDLKYKIQIIRVRSGLVAGGASFCFQHLSYSFIH